MKRKENIIDNFDWLTLWLYLILVTIGIASIYAVNFVDESSRWFDFSTTHGKQMMWIGASLLVGVAVMVIDSKFYSAIAYPFYGLMLIVLLITFLVAPTINGAKSWLIFGPISFQPAEIAKTATALALARYLTTINVSMRQMRTRLISIVLIVVPMVLVVLQRDIGTALVFISFLLVLYREGFPITIPLIGLYLVLLFVLTLMLGAIPVLLGLVALLAVAVAFMIRKLKEYKMRILELLIIFLVSITFVNFGVDLIFNDMLQSHHRSRVNVLIGKEVEAGANYNVQQSKIAIGTGGMTGKGYLEGTLTKGDFVPEQSTDFIFTTIGEEFGFVGSTALLLLFVGLLLRIVWLAERQRSRFTRIYAYGVASILFVHFFVNIGMAIGIIPVIGIPLPFISYGGSSLVGFSLALAILLKLDANRMMVLR